MTQFVPTIIEIEENMEINKYLNVLCFTYQFIRFKVFSYRLSVPTDL